MVYRFKPSEKKHEIREKKPYRRAGADSVRRLYGYRVDEIDLSTIFELKKLEGKVRKGYRVKAIFYKILSFFRQAGKEIFAFWKRLCRSVKKVGRATFGVFSRVYARACRFLEKKRGERREVKDIYILSGALAAVTLVAVLSVFAALYKLIFSEYFGSYEKITVPDMVGMSYVEAREMLDEKNYNITVSYEYSSSSPLGRVLSQYPSGGAERKVYSGGSLPTLSFVVSRGKEMVEIGDLVGKRSRDAELELKNSSLVVMTVEEFSATVPKGSIISTKPSAGRSLEVGGVVVLHVSLGEEKIMLSVPDIVGLTEAEAVSRITSSGFAVGKINYISSSVHAGIVISQGSESYSRLEKGSEISFSVSAGQSFLEKTVPSLYGLTLDEARERLADCGLVLGNVYAAPSYEKKGTVVAQSPSAGSVISSALVSVDIYVGS